MSWRQLDVLRLGQDLPIDKKEKMTSDASGVVCVPTIHSMSYSRHDMAWHSMSCSRYDIRVTTRQKAALTERKTRNDVLRLMMKAAGRSSEKVEGEEDEDVEEEDEEDP